MAMRIDIVFDVADSSPYFAPTLDAVTHALDSAGLTAQTRVVRTNTIDDEYFDDLPDGVVIGPGSPYLAADRAELVVATARERGVPLVGT